VTQLAADAAPVDASLHNTSGAVETVHVALGDRAYDILIGRGVVEQAGARIAALGARAAAVVTDDNVARLHGDRLARNLAGAGVRSELITVPPGEGSKSYATLARVCDTCAAS